MYNLILLSPCCWMQIGGDILGGVSAQMNTVIREHMILRHCCYLSHEMPEGRRECRCHGPERLVSFSVPSHSVSSRNESRLRSSDFRSNYDDGYKPHCLSCGKGTLSSSSRGSPDLVGLTKMRWRREVLDQQLSSSHEFSGTVSWPSGLNGATYSVPDNRAQALGGRCGVDDLTGWGRRDQSVLSYELIGVILVLGEIPICSPQFVCQRFAFHQTSTRGVP